MCLSSVLFQEDEFELTDFEDYDDENGDIFADPASASGVCVYPAACRVMYSYQVVIFSNSTSVSENHLSVDVGTSQGVVRWTNRKSFYQTPEFLYSIWDILYALK